MAKNETIVYWAPAAFSSDEESWSLLYPEPELVRLKLQRINSGFSEGLFACPAVKESLKNTFSLKSAVDEKIDLPIAYLEETCSSLTREIVPSKNRQVVSLYKQRPSSLTGYSNLVYNLSYVFVSEESLHMDFLPPYLPPKTPSPNAILASGGWDIGKWFRPINLDYHVPLDNDLFTVSLEDELAYVRFFTEKKVVLKRFVFSKRLQHLSTEMAASSIRYNTKQSILKRYAMAKNSKIMDLVLSEVKDNLVETIEK
jgi:hypothetical protein